jgi:predicted Zn-dependent peptidase
MPNSDIKVPVHYDTLKNGLRLIVVPDTNVAVVSCRLYYFVGSMYESAGHTGLAHMFEHMMFKGTKKLGTDSYEKEVPIMLALDSLDRLYYAARQKGDDDPAAVALRANMDTLLEKQRAFIKKDEIWNLYKNNGATHLNAWTADDMTAYIVTLPKNKVELFYWIEADRMREPVLREFVSERDVVMEERRMRYDNRPIGRYWERLNALFYIAHPYRNPTIGWASDIRAFTRADLDQYIHRYYTPDNAVIVLVGNVDPAAAKASVERYFGGIPRAARPKEEIVTREPLPVGVTRFSVADEATPRIDMMFHTPGYPNADLYKLDIAAGILSGRSGRLYRRLVDKEGLCTSVDADNNERLFDGYFEISAELKADTDPSKVEGIIRDELGKLAKEPPTTAEMQRITNEIRMSFISDLKDLEGLSDRLAWFERLRSWKDMIDYPGKIAAIKAEEIPAVVREYLDTTMMTIGVMRWSPSRHKPSSAGTATSPEINQRPGPNFNTASRSACPSASCKSSVTICGDFSIILPPFVVSDSGKGLSVVPRVNVMFSPGDIFEKVTTNVPACTVKIARSENGYLIPENHSGVPRLGATVQPKVKGISWLFASPGIEFCDSTYTYKTSRTNAMITFTEKGPVFSGISKSVNSPSPKQK